MQLGKNKFILRVWILMLEKSEGKNHTSKINVLSVFHTIFFLLGGQKMDFVQQRSETKLFHACKGGRIENVRGTTNDVVAHMAEFINYQI